jgi:hypothetical protein
MRRLMSFSVGRVLGWGLAFGLAVLVVALLVDAVATAPGTTVRTAVGEATVEHGSAALARLAYNPPAWLGTALKIGAVAIVGLAALGYRRAGGLDEDVILEMGENGLTVVFALVAANAVVRLTAWSYPVQVLAGGVGGWLAAQALVRGVQWATDGQGDDGPMTSTAGGAGTEGAADANADTE